MNYVISLIIRKKNVVHNTEIHTKLSLNSKYLLITVGKSQNEKKKLSRRTL